MRLAAHTFLALLVPTALALGPQLVLTPPTTMPDEFTRPHALPSLSDALTLQSRVSIFHAYLRELETVHARVADAGANSTLLVPTNKAVMALPRKPHLPQDQPENMPVISEQQEYEKSQAALLQWVAAHIIPTSPIAFDVEHRTLSDDVLVSFVKVGHDGSPKDYAVTVDERQVARIIDVTEASNGMIYILDGTVPSSP